MQFFLFKEGGVKNTGNYYDGVCLRCHLLGLPRLQISCGNHFFGNSSEQFWSIFQTSNTKSVLIFTNNSTQCIQLLVGLWWLFNESIPGICQVILYGLLWESDISDKIPVCSLSRMDPLFNPLPVLNTPETNPDKSPVNQKLVNLKSSSKSCNTHIKKRYKWPYLMVRICL